MNNNIVQFSSYSSVQFILLHAMSEEPTHTDQASSTVHESQHTNTDERVHFVRLLPPRFLYELTRTPRA